jgi:hypothetical protein
MCLLLHDYTLIANVGYVSNEAIIPYTEIRKFANILFKNLGSIPCMYESEHGTVFEVHGHEFIRMSDGVMLMHVMDENFMEYVNGCYDEKIQKIIEDSRDEYFLKNTPAGKRIMLKLQNQGGNNETQLSN